MADSATLPICHTFQSKRPAGCAFGVLGHLEIANLLDLRVAVFGSAGCPTLAIVEFCTSSGVGCLSHIRSFQKNISKHVYRTPPVMDDQRQKQPATMHDNNFTFGALYR